MSSEQDARVSGPAHLGHDAGRLRGLVRNGIHADEVQPPVRRQVVLHPG